jgi:hypothetical protein
MVETIRVVLRAWSYDPYLHSAEFPHQLDIAAGDDAVVESGPGSPRVTLLELSMEDFAGVDTTDDAGAQTEAFAAAVREGLLRAAEWLSRQPAGLFRDLRAAGWYTDVFIGGWIVDDQFDLDLPPEFLHACGALSLTVSICTND